MLLSQRSRGQLVKDLMLGIATELLLGSNLCPLNVQEQIFLEAVSRHVSRPGSCLRMCNTVLLFFTMPDEPDNFMMSGLAL